MGRGRHLVESLQSQGSLPAGRVFGLRLRGFDWTGSHCLVESSSTVILACGGLVTSGRPGDGLLPELVPGPPLPVLPGARQGHGAPSCAGDRRAKRCSTRKWTYRAALEGGLRGPGHRDLPAGSNEAGFLAQILNGGTDGACEIAVSILMLDVLMCRNGCLGHCLWGLQRWGLAALNVDPEELLGGGVVAQSWTVARQTPLSMRFPRHEYWSGLSFLPPGNIPNPAIKLMSPAL